MTPAGADLTRAALEKEEDERLAPCAQRCSGARRTYPLEREGRLIDYRTEFQRDRDRILHSRAFRRLRLKSDGGAFPPTERRRDRLTHTLEVSQLSRTVARALDLNEDLVEAIALGHELGMPPFGRAGEAALASLLAETGGFRYNEQSLRVADRIEKRYAHDGLNLTDRAREGILKHATYGGKPTCDAVGALTGLESLHPEWAPFFEAQVVAVVDDVAGAVGELDDGLRSGELELARVESLPIVRELLRRIDVDAGRRQGPARRPGKGGLLLRASAINRGLTHMMIASIIHQSRRALKAWMKERRVSSPETFLAARPQIRPGTIGLTPPVAKLHDGTRAFLARSLHQGAWQSGVAARARNLLGGLFRALTADPRLADDYVLLRFKEEAGGSYLRDVNPGDLEAEMDRRYRGNPRFARLVADHIAGMTDLFAVSEHERLVGPVPAGATR